MQHNDVLSGAEAPSFGRHQINKSWGSEMDFRQMIASKSRKGENMFQNVRQLMDVDHIIKVNEERRMRFTGDLKSNRNSSLLAWNVQGTRRRTDGVRKAWSGRTSQKKLQRTQYCGGAEFHWDEEYLLYLYKSPQ